ncbi:RcpC/CpaB family pilus assembly protein [Streptomyces sp. NPDC005407]|uniref:RcpC/CpaB family pilus assembly protein n=1 Tax=Streptomyces sp. NPDC005407 TaxID=3155340 RepID=UPI0033A795D9
MSLLPPSPAPEPLGVPPFAPLRVRGGAHRLRRAMRRRRRALAAGLAMTAAALAASGARGADGSETESLAAAPQRERRPAAEMVSAPVRIADAATVRLLRPGDRVDVIAAANSPAGQGSEARVVASGARVAEVPGTREPSAEGSSPDGGALVVLSVPRATAAALAGAGATSRLAVTVC